MMKTKIIAIDFEYRCNHGNEFQLVCCSVDMKDFKKVYWLWDNSETQDLIDFINQHKEDLWVGHWIEKAECRCFIALGLDPAEFNWYDTFTIEMLLENGNFKRMENNELGTTAKRVNPFSLVALQNTYLKKNRDDEKKENFRMLILKEDPQNNKQKIMDYCVEDTEDLGQICVQQLMKFTSANEVYDYFAEFRTLVGDDKKKRLSLDIAKRLSMICALYAKIDMRGIPVNGKVLNAMITKAPEVIQSLKKDFLRKYKGTFKIEGGQFIGGEDAKKIQSIVDNIIKTYGIENHPKTENGGWSLTADNLKMLFEMTQDPFLEDYLELKKKLMMFKGFIEYKETKTGKRVKKDDNEIWHSSFNPKTSRIYPDHIPMKAATGRCGATPSSGFIPGWDKVSRSLITPTEKGKVVVSMDYHSEENAIMACWAKDSNIKKAYESDDYYITLGTQMGVYPRMSRSQIKPLSLGKNYGMGVKALAIRCGLTIDEAKELSNKFEENFSTYYEKRERLGDLYGNVSSIGKERLFTFSDGFRYKYKHNPRTMNSALNNPIQGAGSAILRLIVWLAYKKNLDIIATVHDEIYFECNEEELEEKIALARKIMITSFAAICGDFCKVKVGAPEIIHYGETKFHNGEEKYEKEWNERLKLFGL